MSNNTNTTAVKDQERRKGSGNGAERAEEAPPPEVVQEQAEEPVAAEGAGAGEAEPAEESAEVRQLRADLETARRRVDELARAYQALNKEREEYKQRLARERERLLDVERGNVALTLLEAIDELDRCLAASSNDTSPLAKGVRLIRDGLLSKITQTGIERLVVVGKPFDPNLAEATDMEVTTSPEDDQKVIAEIRAGYQLKGRVIRPARVKVAKYVAPAQA